MAKIRTVLVVEDEAAISKLIAFHLEQNGYDVVTAPDGRRAMELLTKRTPTLLILDLMLPDTDGIDILKQIRSEAKTVRLPVILLTARAEEADRVLGLESGADDYVVKPFSPRELMLRVKKLIALYENERVDAAHTVFGCMELNENEFQLLVNGHKVEITVTEMRLLSELIRCKGQVLSRDQLLQNAWGYLPNVTDRTVDTHVKRLRRKLGPAADYLQTIRGVGYRWVRAPGESTSAEVVSMDDDNA
ncbi:MAG: response regulator [Candidatus Sumerlaeaceae bacterium]